MELKATLDRKRFILYWGKCSRDEWFATLEFVKDLSGRRWEKELDGKPWSVPNNSDIRKALGEYGFVGEGIETRDLSIPVTRPKRPEPWSHVVIPVEEFPELRPYQIDYLRFMEHNGLRGGNGDEMGTGKEHPVSEPVLTPSGWRKTGDLSVGDFVVSAEGTRTRVSGVFPQGLKDVYALTFSDGVVVHAGLEHLWEVRDFNRKYRGGGWVIRTTAQLLASGLTYKNGTSKWEIPDFPGHFDTTGPDLPMDPWLLGALIGNGSTSNSDLSITFNALDVDLIQRAELQGAHPTKRISNTHCPDLSFRGEFRAQIASTLRNTNLAVKSKEKHLPPEFLVAPWDQRVELLRGLMDTDGSNVNNRIRYHTCSPHLGEDVAQLVRSLGGYAVVHRQDRSEEGKPVEWDVVVKTQFCPFSSARKSVGWKADRRMRGNRIEKIELVRVEASVCIMVEHPRHLYASTGYKLTHNTVQACSLLKLHPELRPAVIVVTASTKAQWRREVRRWVSSHARTYILQGKTQSRLTDQQGIYIINWDILDSWAPALELLEPKAIIGDEIQYIGNDTSKRSKAFRKLSHKPTTKAVTVLSGTPISTRPDQYWPVLDVLSPGLFPDKDKFLKRYFPYKFVKGELIRVAARQDELYELTNHLWVRRLKDDVLPDLPEKTYCPVEMECSPDSNYDAALDKVLSLQGLSFEEMQMRLQALSATAFNVKRQAVLDWIAEFLKGDRKLLVFAWHKAVLDILEQALGPACVRVSGGISQDARAKAIKDFQKDPKKRVFLGNILAAGVGLDGLQHVCSDVAFVEFSWSPSAMAQAEDRLHRFDQKNPTNVYYLVAPDTIDEAFIKCLTQRRQDISRIIDGTRDGAEDLKTVLSFIKKR